MTKTILRIDSSVSSPSATRALADQVVAGMPGAKVIQRDLVSEPLPQITEDWAKARLVPAEERSDADRQTLALSDTLLDEIRAADTLVISVPIYNFGVPASLKSWIDLVARPRETFSYTETGPVGLLQGKRAIVVLASGGTPIGADYDFASGYMRHILGFFGITDVEIVTKDSFEAAA